MRIRGAVLEEIGRSRPYSASQPIKIRDLELDAHGHDELLVRIEAAGICHSDLSVVDGNRVRPVPMLLGHEAAGIVEAVGASVKDIQVGQRVVMTFLPRCGHCVGCATDGRLPCIEGSAFNNAGTLFGGAMRLHDGVLEIKHHLGVSGFATHAVVNRRSVVPVGNDVPPDIAAVLGCAVLTGGGALINDGKPSATDDVAIIGLGGVGMAALITALSIPTGKVFAIDAVQEKLSRAIEIGADEAMTPADAVKRGIRANVVIEAAGHPVAFETAVAITAAGGRTVTVGLPNPDARSSISPLVVTAEARTIVGSYMGSAVPERDIPTFEQLWRDGSLAVEELITSHILLDDINEAMDLLADGRAVRQVIVFD